ncbi:MAG: TetR/AcrR family transcriptional regulator [Pseudomonadota bacterium]
MSTNVKNNIPNGKKKAGRPRRFDETVALEAAMEVFWAKGFEGASLDDLTGAMGINRPSLYAAFGDKNALFSKAIDHYGETIASPAQVGFHNEASIEKAVTAYFELALEGQCRNGDCAKGCFIAGMVGLEDGCMPELQAAIAKQATATHQGFVERFDREIKKGRLSPTPDAEARATLMMDLMQAQSYRARTGATRKMLEDQIEMRVRAVLA